MANRNRVFLYDGYQAQTNGQTKILGGVQANAAAEKPVAAKPKLPKNAHSVVQTPKKAQQ